MRTRISLQKALQPPEERKRLFEKFNQFWAKYINKEIKRKFLWVVYRNYPKIKAFRISWGIPENGFNTEIKFRDWFEEKIKKSEKKSRGITYWEKTVPYESLGLILKEERPIEKTVTPRRRFGTKSKFVGIFQRAVEELARDIGLDNSWYYQFEDYILFNTKEMKSVKDAGIKVSKKFKHYGANNPIRGSVVLEFGPNTRLKDIQFIWKDQVEPIKKQLPGYIDIPPNAKPKKPKENS